MLSFEVFLGWCSLTFSAPWAGIPRVSKASQASWSFAPCHLDQNIGFTWLHAAAGELRASCFFQARGSGLMIIKTKLWDSDKIYLAGCRGFNANSVHSHVSAQLSWHGHSLVKLREACWSTARHLVPCLSLQDCFPMFFSPFSTCHISSILSCCTVIAIQGKKNP